MRFWLFRENVAPYFAFYKELIVEMHITFHFGARSRLA
ncbi:MAG: hypothetical protein CM15mP120_24140 [Pseudomonadota bacterium]|nr:MAG: hypothetical protein CM15mP120_24140 [Pseudomonadota bacterium]